MSPQATQAAPTTEPAAPKKKGKAWILLPILAVGLLGGGGYWFSRRGLESTDDAQVDGEVVGVPARTGGTVVAIHFTDNQEVPAGFVLADLDPAPAKARVAQAEANLENAEAAHEATQADARLARTNATGNKAVAKAALQTASVGAGAAGDQINEAKSAVHSADVSAKQADLDLQRTKSLFDSGAVSKSVLDQQQTAHDVAASNLDSAKARLATLQASAAQAQSRVVEASAKADQASDVDTVIAQADAKEKAAAAQVDTAKAALDIAKLDLSYTQIIAPQAGVVSKRTISEGQTVSPGQSVVQLVTPKIWITANFKETQIQNMKVGQKVKFDVDAYPGVDLKGEVESFSGATGSRFTLLPPDNASGNFTKVVQRMPIRVKVLEPPQGVVLRPGMSVDITVDTRH